MPAITIFGAGPALGLATARRFGHEGYRVTLVTRSPETLDSLQSTLEGEGIDTAPGIRTDLADAGQLREAMRTVEEREGLPDVVVYSPGDVSRLPVRASALDAPTLENWLPLQLLAPMTIAHELVPAMRRRGSGALLFALGMAVRRTMPELASVAVSQSALLTYLRSLSMEVAGDGVYVGALLIGSLIEGSAAARLLDQGHFDGVQKEPVVRVSPDRLADQYWTMPQERTETERVARGALARERRRRRHPDPGAAAGPDLRPAAG